ncbi:DUF3500 domain-containing protein [Actinoplanes philippinensis]|uniref:DUF3500 domain-containing protein n=1 Tax=Actinoplanes philippinensis TaxID=35752 RepID=UPI0033CF5B0A
MSRSHRAVLSVALLMLSAGCGSSDEPGTSGTTTATSAAPSGPGGGPGGGGPAGGMGGSCTGSTATPTTAATGAVPAAGTTKAVTAAVAKAQAFLATLSAGQRTAVTQRYTALGTKQCTWSNFPDGLFNGRIGIKLGDLDDTQRKAAYAAVQSVLSAGGFTQVRQEIAGDEQLASQGGAPGNMGEDYYHLVFFGEPSTDEPWTLQFGGHHLAHHISIGGGALSVSPHFSGIQPISFESGGVTVQGMKQETEDLFGLFESLTTEQRTAARTADAYDDLVMGPGSDTGYPDPEGLSYTKLDTKQKALVKAAIRDWVGDAADAFAGPLLDLYDSQLDRTTIAYSGTIEEQTGGAYMRIDGPRVWIEWINTEAAGFHYHTVYRDKLVDYGTGVS